MSKFWGRDHGVPDAEIASAYRPVVRGFLIAAACYYAVISAAHPFYETGSALWVLTGLAIAATGQAFFWWRRLKRAPLSMGRLELACLTTNALFIANVVAYLLVHFEPLKLVYFVLMALVFGISAPSRRVAYVSVAASVLGLLLMARDAPGDLVAQYAFVGGAGAFAALGMSSLMRGAVLRELRARLASDRLNQALEDKLVENDRLRMEAQAASRAKTQFLATISHEIRTPLNGVLGMAQVMSRGDLSEVQRSRLNVMRSSSQSLLSVVNDVLDISQIETGRMEIVPAPFHLDSFAEAMERLYGGLARERGLDLKFHIAPEARGWRVGDQVRLRQVLGNLLSNALKFTEVGSVTVSIEGDDRNLMFSVADTGIGIAPEDQPKVFGKFLQLDGSSTRRVGGSGLGLALCRELLNLMDGSIEFVTALGVGSCFTFQVPCAPTWAPAEATDLPLVAPARAIRILVVDDNPTNRLVLQTLLDHTGMTTEIACDGVEAVAAWESGRWDAILMDIHMPAMDGVQACQTIRGRERALGRARTPIIAVTASVLNHETAGYLQAGMDCVVAKPVEASVLLAAIEACLAPESPAAMAAGA